MTDGAVTFSERFVRDRMGQGIIRPAMGVVAAATTVTGRCNPVMYLLQRIRLNIMAGAAQLCRPFGLNDQVGIGEVGIMATQAFTLHGWLMSDSALPEHVYRVAVQAQLGKTLAEEEIPIVPVRCVTGGTVIMPANSNVNRRLVVVTGETKFPGRSRKQTGLVTGVRSMA